MVQAEVQKTGNESVLATIRKFSRRVQGAGVVKTLRNKRYHSRSTSKAVKKKRALKLLKRRAEFRQMVKEGKIAEPQRRSHMNSGPRENRPVASRNTGSGLGENTPIAR